VVRVHCRFPFRCFSPGPGARLEYHLGSGPISPRSTIPKGRAIPKDRVRARVMVRVSVKVRVVDSELQPSFSEEGA